MVYKMEIKYQVLIFKYQVLTLPVKIVTTLKVRRNSDYTTRPSYRVNVIQWQYNCVKKKNYKEALQVREV